MKEYSLNEVKEMFKGKGGGPEAESVLLDSNFHKKEGVVTLWSNKADAAKVIERCGSSVISFEVRGDGVSLVINRDAFRGIHCAFRRVKERKPRKKKEETTNE